MLDSLSILSVLLLYCVGISTCILVLAGRRRTGAFLVSDLWIVSSIVVLRVRIVWTVLPKVGLCPSKRHLLISVGLCPGSLGFLLPDGSCSTSSFPCAFLIVFKIDLTAFRVLAIRSNYPAIANRLALAQFIRRSVDKNETFVTSKRPIQSDTFSCRGAFLFHISTGIVPRMLLRLNSLPQIPERSRPSLSRKELSV